MVGSRCGGWSTSRGRRRRSKSLRPEAVVNGLVRLVAKVHLGPGQVRVLRIDESGQGGESMPMNQPVSAGVDWIDNGDSITANLSGRWLLR